MGNIIIAGDLLPTETNEPLFENGAVQELFGQEILSLFADSDYRIVNMEGPFTDSNNPIRKSGPCLKASEKSFCVLPKLHIDTASIANNHIMDYGAEGLWSTIRHLDKAGISHCGAGKDRKEAGKPYIFDVQGEKVGLFSCAEYEFTIATEGKPGANPFDAMEIPDILADLKKKTDYVIVLYHGGKEYYRYPAPYVQHRCRKMVEKGADLVICQHSHCIGCREEYKNGTIVYGQGNFILDRGDDEFRNSGLLICCDPATRKIEFHPVVKKGNTVRLADQAEKDAILSAFDKRSKEILQDGFVEQQYEKFAKDMFSLYLSNSFGLLGHGLARLHLGFVLKLLFRRKDYLWQINALRCEAHQDLYLRGLLIEEAE